MAAGLRDVYDAPVALLYAHRGASAELPENTLPSFQRALDLGADALEMDVHLTADGHVLVSHDPHGGRTCGVPSEIRKSTLAEVKRWDAGWGFVGEGGDRPFAGSGYTLPTLEEVLTELPEVPLNVDIKQAHPSMVEPVLKLLRARGAEDRVTLASFRLATLLAARAGGYRGRTSLPRAEILGMLLLPRALYRRLPLRGDVAQMPIEVGPISLSRASVVERCHALGLEAEFWTVNDPAQARHLLGCGADGIMTDDPRRIAPVFAELRGQPLTQSPPRPPARSNGAESPR